MFDRIVKRYDFLNHFLSMGLDIIWRRQIPRYLNNHSSQIILDVGTGTADVLLSLCSKNGKVRRGIGIDISMRMLKRGRKKIERRGKEKSLCLLPGDAASIPFKKCSFDVVAIAFGIRNVTRMVESVREFYRVLKREGRAIILEFSLPDNMYFRSLYLFYFRHVLPVIGSVISGDKTAYCYLNESVERFPGSVEFCNLLTESGFHNVKAKRLSFGIATIYSAEKEALSHR